MASRRTSLLTKTCEVNPDSHYSANTGAKIASRGDWTISGTKRNKDMHISNGNGKGSNKGSKGQGKSKQGKGKGDTPGTSTTHHEDTMPTTGTYGGSNIDNEQWTRAVREVLPEAAVIRSQSTLVQQEWPVPVCTAQTLTHAGGVAAVTRELVADTVKRVGYTGNPAAIVITQEPDQIGFKGYPRQRIRCLLSVMKEDGNREEVAVDRFLVQLGFGEHVKQNMIGPEVQLLTTMRGMIVKMPERHGWPSGPHPAAVVHAELSRLVPSDALAELRPREGPTTSFLVHMDYVDILLTASGQRGIFLKTRDTSDLELLWLNEDTTLEQATQLASKTSALGIAEKGAAAHPRYALRFRDNQKLATIAYKLGLPDTSKVGRWKVTGMHVAVGLHGLADFLGRRGWKDVEILYLAEHTANFLSTNRGCDDPAFYSLHGDTRQLQFKALNAAARGMQKENSEQQASQSRTQQQNSARLTQEPKRTARAAFLQNVQKTQPPDPSKRQHEGNTGETPERKRSN